MATINDALAEMLDALGYTRMSQIARKEKSKEHRRAYARMIVRELKRRKQYSNAASAERKFKRLEQLGEL